MDESLLYALRRIREECCKYERRNIMDESLLYALRRIREECCKYEDCEDCPLSSSNDCESYTICMVRSSSRPDSWKLVGDNTSVLPKLFL